MLWGMVPTIWIAYSFGWSQLERRASYVQVFANSDQYLHLNFGTNPDGLLQTRKVSSVMPFYGEWVSADSIVPVRGMRIKESKGTQYRFDLPDGGAVHARVVASHHRCEPELHYQHYRKGRKLGEGVLTAGFCP